MYTGILLRPSSVGETQSPGVSRGIINSKAIFLCLELSGGSFPKDTSLAKLIVAL